MDLIYQVTSQEMSKKLVDITHSTISFFVWYKLPGMQSTVILRPFIAQNDEFFTKEGKAADEFGELFPAYTVPELILTITNKQVPLTLNFNEPLNFNLADQLGAYLLTLGEKKIQIIHKLH